MQRGKSTESEKYEESDTHAHACTHAHTQSLLARRHALTVSQLSVKHTLEKQKSRVDCCHVISVASVLPPQAAIEILLRFPKALAL